MDFVNTELLLLCSSLLYNISFLTFLIIFCILALYLYSITCSLWEENVKHSCGNSVAPYGLMRKLAVLGAGNVQEQLGGAVEHRTVL